MPRSRPLKFAIRGATIVLAVLALCFIYDALKQKGVVGVGARRVSDKLGATWFIDSVTRPGEIRLGLIVFLLGTPGWTDGVERDWTSSAEEPASSTFVINETQLQIQYSGESGKWSVLDTDYSTEEANVLVLKGCGTFRQEVVHTEKMDLVIPTEADPVKEVLGRSKTLRAAMDTE